MMLDIIHARTLCKDKSSDTKGCLFHTSLSHTSLDLHVCSRGAQVGTNILSLAPESSALKESGLVAARLMNTIITVGMSLLLFQ